MDDTTKIIIISDSNIDSDVAAVADDNDANIKNTSFQKDNHK